MSKCWLAGLKHSGQDRSLLDFPIFQYGLCDIEFNLFCDFLDLFKSRRMLGAFLCPFLPDDSGA